MVEDKYIFDEEDEDSKLPKFVQNINNMARFIWNSKTKEFCGRDGASWAKVSLFYAVFYTLLASFFIGMLAVFLAIMPKDKPTYYGYSSIMNSRSAPLNPGLGFRPQVDVEDHFIRYSPQSHQNPKIGYMKHVENLKNFLAVKYKPQGSDSIKCSNNNSYTPEFNAGKSCEFDYEKIFKQTDCRLEKSFGYNTPTPCVLIKLNKIVSWVPKTSTGYITINCSGENAYDIDNIHGITYHSEGLLNDPKEARIDIKYFPYLAKVQKEYRAPFIWAVFNVTKNTLINVECKAYADNIENNDRLNRRGQTKFTLYIE